MSEREIYLGPSFMLPRRGFVALPIVPAHRLPDGTRAAGALLGRVDGQLVAYANVCRHLAIPLDYGDGEVTEPDGELLLCHHHGATFEPRDGECTGGPCVREFLWRFRVVERDGEATLVVGHEGDDTPGAPP
ncbi:MAG: Rieske 2Fe-2S domain-containing protein [Polyangiaceae bacterium]|nr:Rieske 2Fe-2S domain-containing protein [Polyangiaceae bacterium]